MQPQGTAPINAEYFTKLAGKLGNCSVCADLQGDVDEAMASLQAYKTAVEAQIILLAPILALLSAPGNPTAVITWIENFITGFLTPYIVPYTTYATQLTELASQVSALTTAIENAATKIEGCSITIPRLT